MAYSLKAGTNWCHNFPKLARESGFYFNSHQSRVRIDWNRISTIDIDRVIRDREFAIIDENINNIIDYHLESNYDVKILDPNFVKLFKLAQLSVEYLLYCRQYLDRSVIIFKDELRSKLEENEKLKKSITISEDNIRDLKEKIREKYKIEKKLSDSRGEIHKCPYCPKTFISASFNNSHINRRHSNASQPSISSPVHEKYKSETEKLHSEIKNLKERLNQTERVIRNDSTKLSESPSTVDEGVRASDDVREKKLEEEHKKYREELNNIKTMLFNELSSLKQKNPSQNDSGTSSCTELVKQQENEIQRLRDELHSLSIKNSIVDFDSIQMKLKVQEEYWQKKIQQLELDHHSDIERLQKQLATQESTNRMQDEYISTLNSLELMKREVPRTLKAQILSSPAENDEKNSPSPRKISRAVETDKILMNLDETVLKIHQKNKSEVIIKDLNRLSEKIDGNNEVNGQSDENVVFNRSLRVSDETAEPKNHLRQQMEGLDSPKVVLETLGTEIQVDTVKKVNLIANKSQNSSSETDESNSESDETSKSDSIPSEEKIIRSDIDSTSSSLEETESEDENTPNKTKNLHSDIQQSLEFKLQELGVDSEWLGIPTATYQQLMDTIKYHRNISSRQYSKFAEIRRGIIQKLSEKISKAKKLKNPSLNDVSKGSPLKKIINRVKIKPDKALTVQTSPDSRFLAGKNREKSRIGKLNLELLPKKINQLEFEQRKIRGDKKTSFSMQNLSTREDKMIESSNVKEFLHSYESIKSVPEDKLKKREDIESPESFRRVMTTSTPENSLLTNSMSLRHLNASVLSPVKKIEESINVFTSPKQNKGVLKSVGGSTGSLVKKKVLFDLQSQNDEVAEKVEVLVEVLKPSDADEGDSTSDFEVSSILEEKSKLPSPNPSGIVLKTLQSEKIAQITRKIDEQLRSTRQKPVGGVDTLYVDTFNVSEKIKTQETPSFNAKLNKVVNERPQPAPRNPKNQFVSPEHKSDYNIDLEIDELLKSD